MAATVHVTVHGRVQGVGYRAWAADEAERLGLSGWVRNRRDGTVEAVVSGEPEAVQTFIALCRDGPRAALVFDVKTEAYDNPPTIGFKVLPTV
ncbi:MAG TPA: acylphosphatase [Bauldia sp.]|nr:acylphosphatase [Bauldia sp.]